MATEPFPTERIHDPQFEELVAGICARPSMYVSPATFGAVCAYIQGFDAARSGGPLTGLQQWLVVRANDGNNLAWPALAERLLPVQLAERELSGEEPRISALGCLLSEFFEYRRDNGLTKLFHDYAKWLLRKSWYTGPLRQGASQDG